MKRIRLTESQFNKLVSKCVKKALREQQEDIKSEINQIVTDNGEQIDYWVNDYVFVATNGCDGHIFNSEEEADESIRNSEGENHQNAIDYVESALSEDEWIEYLMRGGVDAETANDLINNGDWEGVVNIILDKVGPEWFLANYSGQYYNLSNGQILYF